MSSCKPDRWGKGVSIASVPRATEDAPQVTKVLSLAQMMLGKLPGRWQGFMCGDKKI